MVFHVVSMFPAWSMNHSYILLLCSMHVSSESDVAASVLFRSDEVLSSGIGIPWWLIVRILFSTLQAGWTSENLKRWRITLRRLNYTRPIYFFGGEATISVSFQRFFFGTSSKTNINQPVWCLTCIACDGTFRLLLMDLNSSCHRIAGRDTIGVQDGC